MKILFIDTETGGIGLRAAEHWSLIQIGAVVWDSTNPGGGPTFVRVVNEEKASHGCSLQLHPEALMVNGFTTDRIRAEGLSPAHVTSDFLAFLYEHFPDTYNRRELITLGGHCVHFDAHFLGRLFRLASASYGDLSMLFDSLFSHRMVDTSAIAKFLIQSRMIAGISEGASSSELFDFFRCKPVVPHDALSDATATAQLYEKMLHYMTEAPLLTI